MDFTAGKMDAQFPYMRNLPLQIEQLSYQIGASALFDDLNASFELGQIVGLIGANGAGKSTFQRILAGICQPLQGCIRWQGVDVYRNLPQFKSQLAYLPSCHFLFAHLTVGENLRWISRLRQQQGGVPQSWTSVLAQSDLLGYQKVLYGQLSDGLKKRVELAAMMIHQPPLLILDEPCAQLDPQQREFLWTQLQQLNHPERLIIFSSHHTQEIQNICHQIVVLKGGQLMPFPAHKPSQVPTEVVDYEMA